MGRRVLVLIDGEHYPPVIEAALNELGSRGDEIAGLVHLGGTEKLSASRLDDSTFGSPVIAGEPPLAALEAALERFRPDAVIDLSDQPILGPKLRMLLASRALAESVPYEGADFSFAPPRRPRLAALPSIAVIGTGKRTGKTAIAAALARAIASSGGSPIVVAMGRGGPEEPEVIHPHAHGALTPDALVALADDGRHAASDHIEDAVVAEVTTVGTRRCGGGLAGEPGASTFQAGVEIANAESAGGRHDVMILEGSGSAIPPVHADATVLAVPGHIDIEELDGYMGPYRVMLADVVVVVGGGDDEVEAIESVVRGLNPGARVVAISLAPYPLAEVTGRRTAVATTAATSALVTIAEHLVVAHGADIVSITNALSDRERLVQELPAILEGADVVVTEVKAAGIDVVARAAREAGIDVVFLDNRPIAHRGAADFAEIARYAAEVARKRHSGESN